ncbi:MAG: hypothetical protein KDN05_05460 [Verrucomicrobiae bacterium]|nr:hypothetical protein [Verrucomicrobiae bacterium]
MPCTVAAAGASFTLHSQGLLTDVVRGGLKTDLNLGFELADSDFAKDSWGDTKNPFRASGSNAGVTSPTSYRGQQPLFKPLVENPIVSVTTDFSPASVSHRFYGAGVPTFDHLRSFYRIPHHLYGGTSPVVAERGPDHVAVKVPSAAGGTNFAPSNPPAGQGSVLAIRPVLNRMVYLLSSKIGADGQVRLVITPVVSLWNPYNIALEVEGAVAYPWIDIPFRVNWKIKTSTGSKQYNLSMSKLMGKQFESQNHGRSVNPYFFCQMTASGTSSLSKPIRFEPGEVRVFVPTSPTPTEFVRLGSNYQRVVWLRPVDDVSQMNTKGGLSVPMKGGVYGEGFDYQIQSQDTVTTEVEALNGQYNYFVSLEDASRIKDRRDTTRGEAISDVQVWKFASAIDRVTSPEFSFAELRSGSRPFGVIETFHRVAKQGLDGQPIADLIYTTNPRQPAINHQLSEGSFTVAPHYQSTLRSVASFDGAIQTTPDGRCSFWGASQSSSGREQLPFFEIPREPLLSMAAFQHADLASSTFSASNQFGNSWASPYLASNRVGKVSTTYVAAGVPIYDSLYLTNEALWDGYFFSGAAPRLRPASSGDPQSAWKSSIATVERSLEKVLDDFVDDPQGNPLGNSRMRLFNSGYTNEELVDRLLEPAGCTRIASHLIVDGAFNINSTDLEAWVAFLSGLRDQAFDVIGGSSPSNSSTAFPRFRHPTGEFNDNWNGFRMLSDSQLLELATNIVAEVRKRGPFLSLAEFVNRRVESTDLGRSGAIQAAINSSNLNADALQATFDVSNYPSEARRNIVNDTGVGIPGYLTQSDVLQSIAPVITPRSDTFIVRGYGETKNSSGKVTAQAWCEAVVQRIPDFVDPATPAESALASANITNQTFGRRFQIITFQEVSPSEL